MKKYFFGIKNILLLLASFLPLIRCLIGVLILDPLYINHPAWREFVNVLNSIFSIPLVYFGTLVLILFLSRDVWHCLILSLLQMISTLLYIFIGTPSGVEQVGVEGVTVILIFVLNVFLAIHGGVFLLKMLMERKKKRKQVQTAQVPWNGDIAGYSG